MNNIHFDINEFNEFCELYWQICITNESFYWIVFFILFGLSFYFAKKKNEIKKVLLVFLMPISIMIVMFSLYLCGKTFNGVNPQGFFIQHNNIIFVYKMLLITPLLFYFGYTTRNLSKKFNNKTSSLITSIILILGIIYFGYLNIHKYNYDYQAKQNMMIELRKTTYKMEKILRFYYLQNLTPYIPSYLRNIPNQSFAFANVKLNDENPECYRDILVISYYPRIYNDYSTSRQKGYCFCDDAMKKYYDLGGTFTEEELNNIQFKRLFDEKFVLNL